MLEIEREKERERESERESKREREREREREQSRLGIATMCACCRESTESAELDTTVHLVYGVHHVY
jgi:hypothetical protein